MPLIFEHLPNPTDEQLTRVRAIYESNFPLVMQKPFAIIAQGSRNGAVTLLVARDQTQPQTGEPIVGIATLAHLPRTPVLYLGYFAVDLPWQNQGIGRQLFWFMVRFVTENAAVDAMVWEVEAPEPGHPAHIRNRRIRFYEQLGAQVVTLASTYRMPDNTPDGGTIPLRLMWLPMRGRQHPPDRAEVAAWISDIYDLVYPSSEGLAAQIIAEMNAG